MKTFRIIAGIAASLLMVFAASAASLNFEGLPYTLITSGGTIPPNPASVITDGFGSQGVIFGKAGVSFGVAVVQDSLAPSSGVNSVAGLDAAGMLPGSGGGAMVGDIYFQFVVPGTSAAGIANGVSFTIGDGGGDLDIFQIRAYDLSDALISSQDVSGVSRFLVSIPAAGIHRVVVDFTGDFGYSLDDLTFTPVPEPASFALLMLGAVPLLLRRKSAL